jgi:predicted dehydrogenase
MERVRWGIIGCGDVTEVKSGPAFSKVPNSQLVAVMRRDADKAKDYAMRHGVAYWLTDATALINHPEVNAVYIATPPLQHEQFAIEAMQAGKPVYVEKPMALTLEAAKNINKVAADTGVRLTVAHYRRQLPLFKRVKEIIDSGLLGTIRLINLQLLQPHESPLITKTQENWRVDPKISGGGLFHDLAPHQLDLMIYFFGNVKKASGIAYNQGNYYNADDIVQGSIVFENGALFNGVWSFTVAPPATKDLCEVIGTNGSLSFSIFKHDQLRVIIDGDIKEETFSVPQHVQQPMIEQVVKYFLNESANPCSAEDGVEVMRLIEAFTAN